MSFCIVAIEPDQFDNTICEVMDIFSFLRGATSKTVNASTNLSWLAPADFNLFCHISFDFRFLNFGEAHKTWDTKNHLKRPGLMSQKYVQPTLMSGGTHKKETTGARAQNFFPIRTLAHAKIVAAWLPQQITFECVDLFALKTHWIIEHLYLHNCWNLDTFCIEPEVAIIFIRIDRSHHRPSAPTNHDKCGPILPLSKHQSLEKSSVSEMQKYLCSLSFSTLTNCAGFFFSFGFSLHTFFTSFTHHASSSSLSFLGCKSLVIN